MKTFAYTIKDALGIHARPAGILVKEAKNYESKIMITKGTKTVEATRLMAMMGMAVKKGDTVTVSIEGPDEAQAFEAIKIFFENHL